MSNDNNYDRDSIIICPHCQGTGEAFSRVPFYQDAYQRTVYTNVLQPCMLCHGERAVKQQIKYESLN